MSDFQSAPWSDLHACKMRLHGLYSSRGCRQPLIFLDGELVVNSHGRKGPSNYCQTVVPSGEELYLEDLPPFVNAGSEALIKATAVDHKLHVI